MNEHERELRELIVTLLTHDFDVPAAEAFDMATRIVELLRRDGWFGRHMRWLAGLRRAS